MALIFKGQENHMFDELTMIVMLWVLLQTNELKIQLLRFAQNFNAMKISAYTAYIHMCIL